MSFLKTAVTAVTAAIVVAGGGMALYRLNRLLDDERVLTSTEKRHVDLEIEIAENELLQVKSEVKVRLATVQREEEERHERHILEIERLRQIAAVQEARHAQLMTQFNDPMMSPSDLSDLAREFMDNLKQGPEALGGLT